MTKKFSLLLLFTSLILAFTGCSSSEDDDGSGSGTAAVVCDTTHLSLCTTESDCVGASGNWYVGSCHNDPSSSWNQMEWDKGQWK